jgi:hypothetical protein
MRIEEHHGKKVVCGHFFPITEIKVGQVWQGGLGACVTITKVDIDRDQIYYAWEEAGGVNVHNKEAFAFQCRYCKVVD